MKFILSIFLLSVSFLASSQPVILTQRDQARVIDELLEDRLRNTLGRSITKYITRAHAQRRF